MGIAFGISWNDSKRGRMITGLMAAVIALSLAGPTATAEMGRAAGDMVSVIIRELPGSGSSPETAVKASGGEVGRHIGIINGFVAEVPEGALARLENLPGVHS